MSASNLDQVLNCGSAIFTLGWSSDVFNPLKFTQFVRRRKPLPYLRPQGDRWAREDMPPPIRNVFRINILGVSSGRVNRTGSDNSGTKGRALAAPDG
jgi:hypothetical protein